MKNATDYVVVPRCDVKYMGASFPHLHGRRCTLMAGHETLPMPHPLSALRHISGEGSEKIMWFTEAQKVAGIKDHAPAY